MTTSLFVALLLAQTTPNMGLYESTPGVTPGVTAAQREQSNYLLLDSHNHAPGHGVPVPIPAGVSWAAGAGNLQTNGNSLLGLNYCAYDAGVVGTPPLDSTFVCSTSTGCATAGKDLCYKDGNGNVIPLTCNGGVSGAVFDGGYINGKLTVDGGVTLASGCVATPAGCTVCDDGTNLVLTPTATGVVYAKGGLTTDGGLVAPLATVGFLDAGSVEIAGCFSLASGGIGFCNGATITGPSGGGITITPVDGGPVQVAGNLYVGTSSPAYYTVTVDGGFSALNGGLDLPYGTTFGWSALGNFCWGTPSSNRCVYGDSSGNLFLDNVFTVGAGSEWGGAMNVGGPNYVNNGFTFNPEVVGTSPQIQATCTDANCNLVELAQGTGSVQIGTLGNASTSPALTTNGSGGIVADGGPVQACAPNTANCATMSAPGDGTGAIFGSDAGPANLIAISQLDSSHFTFPTGVTVTPQGTTGSTAYFYCVTAYYEGYGETPCYASSFATNGNATLSGTNYNTIAWTNATGATSENVYLCGDDPECFQGQQVCSGVTSGTCNDTGATRGVEPPHAFVSDVGGLVQDVKPCNATALNNYCPGGSSVNENSALYPNGGSELVYSPIDDFGEYVSSVNPQGPSCAYTGAAGSTTYTYEAECYAGGDLTWFPTGATFTCSCTSAASSLSTSNYCTVTFVPPPGSVCRLARTAGGASQGWLNGFDANSPCAGPYIGGSPTISTCPSGRVQSWRDNGSPSVTGPASPSASNLSGTAVLGGPSGPEVRLRATTTGRLDVLDPNASNLPGCIGLDAGTWCGGSTLVKHGHSVTSNTAWTTIPLSGFSATPDCTCTCSNQAAGATTANPFCIIDAGTANASQFGVACQEASGNWISQYAYWICAQ